MQEWKKNGVTGSKIYHLKIFLFDTLFGANYIWGAADTEESLKTNEKLPFGKRSLHLQWFPPYHQDTFQDPQWMLETIDSTEPYKCYVFSYAYIPTYGKVEFIH